MDFVESFQTLVESQIISLVNGPFKLIHYYMILFIIYFKYVIQYMILFLYVFEGTFWWNQVSINQWRVLS